MITCYIIEPTFERNWAWHLLGLMATNQDKVPSGNVTRYHVLL